MTEIYIDWADANKGKFSMDSKGFVLFPSENLGFIKVRFYTDIIAKWAKTRTTKYAPYLTWIHGEEPRLLIKYS